jgi:hypothetical protein
MLSVCQFAFELLEWIFSQLKVTLVVLDHEDSKSHDTELADDLLSIIHVYSCRQMGRRRYLHKKNKDLSHPKTEDHAQTMDDDSCTIVFLIRSRRVKKRSISMISETNMLRRMTIPTSNNGSLIHPKISEPVLFVILSRTIILVSLN